MLVSFDSQMANFIRLQSFTLDNIYCYRVDMLLTSLKSLPMLASLTIKSIDCSKESNKIYENILQLPFLKYCQTSITALETPTSFPLTSNQCSPLTHLIINHPISLNRLDSLLPYLPYLRHLSLGYLDGLKSDRTRNPSVTLNNLITVHLTLNFLDFNDFELLVHDFFHHVQVFRFSISESFRPHSDYLNATRWKQLITNHLPNLRIFDYQHECSARNGNVDWDHYEVLAKQFNSTFWFERQWFFKYHYYRKDHTCALLYSTSSYKPKHYSLCDQLNESNLKSIRHLKLERNNSIDLFTGYFPNVTQLTFTSRFDAYFDMNASRLNRIVPLKQITQLFIHSDRFSFKQLLELLSSTTNIRTLEFNAFGSIKIDMLSIKQTEHYKYVSKINAIKRVRIRKVSTVDEIKLYVHLFPRLESLMIGLVRSNFRPIVRFVLLQSYRYLSSMCIYMPGRDHLEQIKKFIDSEKLLCDYKLKYINSDDVYLWW